MSEKSVEKKATQARVGYVPIYRTSDYGGRTIENCILYEEKVECELDCRNDDNFLTIGILTWEE